MPDDSAGIPTLARADPTRIHSRGAGMTVSTSPSINTSTANGATTVFPYAFRILKADDLYVSLNGVRATLGIDYTLSGVGAAGGGNITFVNAPANGTTVLRMRLMAFKRDTDYQTGGELRASEVNTDFDAAVMMIQQLSALAMTFVDDGAGSLSWDALGRRIVNLGDAINETDALNMQSARALIERYELAGMNTDPLYWQFEDEGVSQADGVQKKFYIPGASLVKEEFYDFFVDGVAIEPYEGYTVTITPDTSGSFVTFAIAPANGAEVWGVSRGYAKPLGTDLLVQLMNDAEFLALLASIVTNTLYETTNVLRLGPVRMLIPKTELAETTLLVTGLHESHLIRCTSAEATTLTIRANTDDPELDFEENPIAATFFSVVARGEGTVTVEGEEGVTITTPSGYLPQPRTVGSVITLTCDYAAGNQWLCSGDMAVDAGA